MMRSVIVAAAVVQGVAAVDVQTVPQLLAGETDTYGALASSMHRYQFLPEDKMPKPTEGNFAEQTKRSFEFTRAMVDAHEKRVTKEKWDSENKEWLKEKKDIERLAVVLHSLVWAKAEQKAEAEAAKAKTKTTPAQKVEVSQDNCRAAIRTVFTAGLNALPTDTEQARAAKAAVEAQAARIPGFIVADPSKKADDNGYRIPSDAFEAVVVAIRKMTYQDLSGFDARVEFIKAHLMKNGCSSEYADRFGKLFGDNGFCMWCCCCFCWISILIILIVTIILVVMCCCCKKSSEEVTDAGL